jgi:beta-galactosidase
VSTLRVGRRVVDRVVTRFGIRTIRFDPDRGFFLNGQRVQINGVCNHQDHAGVGAAVPDRLHRYRLERLKEMGVNAYRTSHNPPAQEVLDLCDELGILVMDETRLFSSSDLALEHLRALVRRDRNHPSVVLWSIGNEEPEQATARGNRIARSMIRAVKTLDLTRPLTYASNSGAFSGVNEVVDVRGFNYHTGDIDSYHKEHPRQPLIGSEIASTLCTRGEYAVDESRGYMSAYDKAKPQWGELAEEWMTFYMARPWLAGAFVWTGFDYRGEPTPYEWPCVSSHFGILDTCGFPKDLFWYYRSWWTREPVLHLMPHWNWRGREGRPIEVWAFSNADEVRLSLNGRDLGARRIERYGHAAWQVPYEAGVLGAVGYRNGQEIARTAVETTGDASRVELKADRASISADLRDVAVVTVSAVDDRGRPVPDAGHDVFFELSGPGRILGVGNGDPSSHEADTFAAQAPLHRRLFNGLAQVLVQSTDASGSITLRGRADGLTPSTIVIRSVSAPSVRR